MSDKELRERAEKIASVYGDDKRVIRNLADAIFRELASVRDQVAKGGGSHGE